MSRSGVLSEGYEHEHYDYQCPSESLHVRIVSSDNVDDSKVIEDLNILSEVISIVKDTIVDSLHRLLMRTICLLIVSVMTWMR